MSDQIRGFRINSAGFGTIPKLVMQDKNLNIAAKAIYAYFCSYTGAGDTCFPTRKKICYDLDISNDTLGKHLKNLVRLGYIKVEQIRENGRFSHNVYTLTDTILPCPKISDTEKTDTEKTDTDKMDTKINSINKINNIKISKKVSKKEGTKNSFPGDDLSFSNDNFMISDLKEEINHNKTSDRISVSIDAIKEQKKLLVGTKHDKASNKTSEPINADKGKELEGLDLNNAKRAKAESFDSIISNYSENPRLKAAILDYIKMRKLVKSPLTNRALNLVLNRLQKLSSSEDEQIAILEQSIVNCWKGVFPLRNDNTIGTSSGANNSKNNKNVKPARELNEYEKQNKEMLMAIWGIKNDK